MTSILTGLYAYGIAASLLPTALLISPNTLTHKQLASIFLPLIWYADIRCWLCGLGALPVIHGFWATDLLLFRDPRKDFRVLEFNNERKRQDEKTSLIKGGQKTGYPATLWKRFWWVLKVVVSFRFIGLDIGNNKSIINARSQATSRGQWLLQKALLVAICVLLLDGTTSWSFYDPYFLTQASIDSVLPAFLPAHKFFSLSPRLFRLALLALQHYAMIEACHLTPAIICVSLGAVGLVSDWWGNPSNWPSVMGNPLVVFKSGLRGFWGKCWQQLFRSMFLDPGKALVRVLNVQQRSLPAYIILITVAFLVSSIFHGLTFPVATPDLDRFRYASFFWLQALGVLFEVTFERVSQRTNTTPNDHSVVGSCAKMVVRGLWTLSVFYYTIPLYGSELAKFQTSVERQTLMFPMP